MLLAIVFSSCKATSQSQNWDSQYNQPVSKTIEKIEEIFQVEIVDDRNLLEGKVLNFGDWRIRHDDLELSLTSVLAPFHLMYYRQHDGSYTIRKYEHHKVTSDIGQKRLAYLENLYNSKEEWEQRRDNLKQCMIESLLVDKAPEQPNSEPIITNFRKHGKYSIENIALEILPGIYATGSIYKPYPLKKNHAVILTPNGHFGDGRYRESEQIRCGILAQMGAIVINYDLFAWGESQLQFEAKYHRTALAQTIQVLNGIRLLDYALSLPQADNNLVGITGGSGGGSHTMFLTAIDDRIKVSVPTVMVSSWFSGGCPCESGQPIHLCENGTNNAEIAAMAAPRPQLIISDGGDWTSSVPEIEFPFIKRTYGFYDARSVVENVHFPDEGHDYGESKRKAMYAFMAKHLNLNLAAVSDKKEMIDESKVVIEEFDELKVFGKNGENLPENAIKSMEELYHLFDLKFTFYEEN